MRRGSIRSFAPVAAVLLLLTAMPVAPAAAQPVGIGGTKASSGSGVTGAVQRTAAMDWKAPAQPGSLLVVLKTPATDAGKRAAVASRLAARGAGVRRWTGGGRAVVVDTQPGAPATSAGVLATADEVAWVQPNFAYRAAWTPSDPEYSGQWGPARIGAPAAWDFTRGSAAVRVAVIDTGVDLDHPDLVDRVDAADGHDFVNQDGIADDDHGHGTHVAGIIAATANNGRDVAGMAPDCRIVPVKVLDDAGSGWSSDVADGIIYAADQGVKVINLSLGGGGDDLYLENAVRYALARGVLIVAAAGNEHAYGALYPAACDGVLGVAATEENDDAADFSNYGPGVDVAAPGVRILSTIWPGDSHFSGGYTGVMSGTSMATPMVAGLAALIRSKNPTWTWQDTANVIQGSAEDLGKAGLDDFYGHGLVRADVALAVVNPPRTDDDVPGVALPGSNVTGVLEKGVDDCDVYRVRLEKGATLNLQLNGWPTADYDLFVYGPQAISVYTDQPVAASGNGSFPERIAYKAPSAGDYYVAVYAYSGEGQYGLATSVSPPLTIASASFSNPVAYKIQSLLKTNLTARIGTSNVHARLTVAVPGGAPWTVFDGDIANVAGQPYTFPAWDGKDPATGKPAPYAANYTWTLTVSKQGYTTSSCSGQLLLANVYFARSGRSTGGATQYHTGYLFGSGAQPQGVNVYVSASAPTWDDLAVNVTGPASYAGIPTNSPWRVGPGAPAPPTGRLAGYAAVKANGVYTFGVTGTDDVSYTISIIE